MKHRSCNTAFNTKREANHMHFTEHNEVDSSKAEVQCDFLLFLY